MGDDIGSGLSSMAVGFDFCSTNVVQLSDWNWNSYIYRFQCHHPIISQLRFMYVCTGIKKLLNAGLSLCVNGVLYDDVMDSFSNADIMFVLQFRDTNIWGLLPQMQGFPGLLLQTCAFRAPS